MLLEKLQEVFNDQTRTQDRTATLRMIFGRDKLPEKSLILAKNPVAKQHPRVLGGPSPDTECVMYRGQLYSGSIQPATLFKALQKRRRLRAKPVDSSVFDLYHSKTPLPSNKQPDEQVMNPQLKVQSRNILAPTSSYLLKQRIIDLKSRLPNIYYDKPPAQVYSLSQSPTLESDQSLKFKQSEFLEDAEQEQIVVSYNHHTTQRPPKMQLIATASIIHDPKDIEIRDKSALINLHRTDITGLPTIKLSCSESHQSTSQSKKKSSTYIVHKFQTQTQSPNKDRSSISQVERPICFQKKYFKGYLAYDQACHKLFKTTSEATSTGTKFQKGLPNLTAHHFAIMDCNTLEFLILKTRSDQEIEIASLSKIVTAILTILACTKYEIDIDAYKCRISEEAAAMSGTSASLESGDIVSIRQLLYALMLPSGNDAAVALAECIGRIIQRFKKRPFACNPARLFIKHMNIFYRELLRQEDRDSEQAEHVFQNPSGLPNNPNRTTVEQIMRVAAIAMRNAVFKEIVCTKEFEVVIKNERYGLSRKTIWRNTNKLLWKDWEGVKTGTTQTAGHCFIGKHKDYLVGVFDTSTLSRRFSEASDLLNWLTKKL